MPMKIPNRELWLFKNPSDLASVKRGLSQAKEGKIIKMKTPCECKNCAKRRKNNKIWNKKNPDYFKSTARREYMRKWWKAKQKKLKAKGLKWGEMI